MEENATMRPIAYQQISTDSMTAPVNLYLAFFPCAAEHYCSEDPVDDP